MENHTIVYNHEGRSHFHFSITMIKQILVATVKAEKNNNTTYKEHYVGLCTYIAIIIVNTVLFPVDFCHITTGH